MKYLYVLMFLVCLTSNCFSKGVHSYREFSEYICLYKNNHELFVEYNSMRIFFRYLIPKKSDLNVTHIQFKNIKAKEIKTGEWRDYGICVQSKKIPVYEKTSMFHERMNSRYSKDYYVAGFYYGSGNELNHDTSLGNYSFLNIDRNFEDHLVFVTVTCFNNDEVVFEKEFQALAKRFYKEKTFGFFNKIPENWYRSDSIIFQEDGNPFVRIEDEDFYNKDKQIKINYFGQLSIKDGGIFFIEDKSKREAYYKRKLYSKYEKNEKFGNNNVTFFEKIYVEADPYFYNDSCHYKNNKNK